MEHNVSLGCVVMAAGNARRFGANKLAAPLGGRSLILRCLEAVPAEQFERVVVVTQYPEIMRLAKEFHFAAIHNQHPEIGLSHTIQLGLTALRDCSGVMFLVSDQPLLRRESIALLAGRCGSTEPQRRTGQSLCLSRRIVFRADVTSGRSGWKYHPPAA